MIRSSHARKVFEHGINRLDELGLHSHAQHRGTDMTDTVPGEGHTKGLSELLAKVQAASGPLDNRTALELHVMGWGKLTDFAPVVDRDEYGGWALTYQVDAKGGGRQKCTMPEDRLPDRSIDAALALVERVLPGWWYHMAKGRLSPSEPLFACALYPPGPSDPQLDREPEEASTQPLAIIKALLTAIGDSQP